MDPRFPVWIQFILKSQDDIDHRVNQMKRMFGSAGVMRVTRADFSSDTRLLARIKLLVRNQSRELSDLMTNDRKTRAMSADTDETLGEINEPEEDWDDNRSIANEDLISDADEDDDAGNLVEINDSTGVSSTKKHSTKTNNSKEDRPINNHPEKDVNAKDGPRRNTNKQRAFITIAHDIEALRYYSRFLGYTHRKSEVYVTKIGLRASFYLQSRISMTIQDGASSASILQEIMTTLRHQQAAIDDRICRWLRYGSLAECTDSLIQFGIGTLRPFIELCLRYTFQPMSTEKLKDIRITVSRTITDDVDYCIGSDALNALPRRTKKDPRYAKGLGRPPDLLIVHGRRIAHVRMVYPNKQTSASDGKLVVRDLDPALSAYIYFYHKYCKVLKVRTTISSKSNRILNKYQSGSTNLLFTGRFGGPWKEIPRDVRTYASAIQLPIQKMGLQSQNYHRISQVQWMATRAVQTALELSNLTADAIATGIAFKNDNKYYTGLSTLRTMQRALDLFETDGSHATLPHLQIQSDQRLYLNRPHKDLDSLYAEMQSTDSTHIVEFVTKNTPHSQSLSTEKIHDRKRWETSITDHLDLHSMTITTGKNTNNTTYLQKDRRNRQIHWQQDKQDTKNTRADVIANNPINGTLVFSCVRGMDNQSIYQL
jgi:hypothetical protein